MTLQPDDFVDPLGRQTGDTWTHIGLRMRFAYIPAGKFLMGSPADEYGRRPGETQHSVRLTKPFLMATSTVTQVQWKAVTGRNPSRFKGVDLPVEMVSWDDAIAFCEKLSKSEGKKYRLPTEAEWEFCCRAGTTTAYHAGEGASALKEAGWCTANSGGKTHPVGQKRPNPWGLYDMHGNVWQWCNDYHGEYPAGKATDPTGPSQGVSRVLRGGSWSDVPEFCRAAYRIWAVPSARGYGIGLRLCLDF